MLREDVVEAERQGKFHIYPVRTIDEGITVLTGVEAGERQEDSTYPEGTVNHAVQNRLRELATKLKDFGKKEEEATEGEESEEIEGKQKHIKDSQLSKPQQREARLETGSNDN